MKLILALLLLASCHKRTSDATRQAERHLGPGSICRHLAGYGGNPQIVCIKGGQRLICLVDENDGTWCAVTRAEAD